MKTCQEEVTSDGWHFHTCGKKAKYVLLTNREDSKKTLCGIHARFYKKNQPENLVAIETNQHNNRHEAER